MHNKKTQAPCFILEDKQYKLSDFFEEFGECGTIEDKIQKGIQNIDSNIITHYNMGEYTFKYNICVCPECGSHSIHKHGFTKRILYFLEKGRTKCHVQRYICKKCGKSFQTDLKSIVKDNTNITLPVFDTIVNLHSIFGESLYKIRDRLNEEHNVNISHQSIENILIESKITNKVKN